MKILLIGPISPPISGPGLKNKLLIETLKEKGNSIKAINTMTWKKERVKTTMKILFNRSDNVILSISRRGRLIISPILIIKRLLNRKFHYAIIPAGGGVDEELDELKGLKRKIYLLSLINADFIFVQTNMLKKNIIQKYSLENVEYMPNFKKNYRPSKKNEKVYFDNNKDILKLVFVSRVKESKGIEIAINAVIRIHEKKILKVEFDIFGPIADEYEEKFHELLKSYSYINYKGIIDSDRVSEAISKYDILLFPTFWKTEGFPGILLDAFNAGLPVIATDWMYNSEVIKDGYNGLLVAPQDVNDLHNKIRILSNDKALLKSIGENNLKEAKLYNASNVVNVMIEKLKSKGW